jgi:hypothetical protein
MMGHTMRTHAIALAAAGSLALLLAGCGGGGGGTAATPTSPLTGGALPTPEPNPKVINFTGKTGRVSVSIKIPKTGPKISAKALANVRARYGGKRSDKRLRTAANTSPSASIRAWGGRRNEAAYKIYKATGREPQYISGNTAEMELVLLDSNSNVVYDAIVDCSNQSSTCTAQFDAPIGTGYTLGLYLYDNCTYLLGAGAGAVNITEGQDNPVLVTVNPVAAYFQVSSDLSGNSVFGDPSQATGFNVSVSAVDADFQTVAGPGVLLDESLTQLTGVSVQVGSSNGGVSGGGTLNLVGGYQIDTATVPFTWDGTGTGQFIITANANYTGSPILPASAYFSPSSTSGAYNVAYTAASVAWNNTQGYPGFTGSGTSNASMEFPLATNTATVQFSVSSNLPGYAGNITLSDNGYCGSTINGASYSPSLGVQPYATVNGGFSFQMASSSATNQCVISAQDDGGRIANLSIYTNQSSLTIQQRARKQK